jgi:hypothetical protein
MKAVLEGGQFDGEIINIPQAWGFLNVPIQPRLIKYTKPTTFNPEVMIQRERFKLVEVIARKAYYTKI